MHTEPRRLAFERLIRNALAFPHRPAVVVVMISESKPEFWQTAENDMLVIAAHYQLPVISSRCASPRALLCNILQARQWRSCADHEYLSAMRRPCGSRAGTSLVPRLVDPFATQTSTRYTSSFTEGSTQRKRATCVMAACIRCRAAFSELMATNVEGFRVTGRRRKHRRFFFADSVHPSTFGYRVMMELLANFMRQVRPAHSHPCS